MLTSAAWLTPCLCLALQCTAGALTLSIGSASGTACANDAEVLVQGFITTQSAAALHISAQSTASSVGCPEAVDAVRTGEDDVLSTGCATLSKARNVVTTSAADTALQHVVGCTDRQLDCGASARASTCWRPWQQANSVLRSGHGHTI